MKIHSFDNAETLNHDFAEQIAAVLQQAIEQRGQAYLVVSGGTTPKPLFKKLSERPLDWKNITITLADERKLPVTAADSNERMVRETLLQNFASKARFISLNDESKSFLDIEQTIALLPTFDAVILGMGEDGHTASLFPCSPEIKMGLDDETTSAVLEVHPMYAPYQRISLTKKRLLNSRVVFLHLVGEKKLAVFNQALERVDPLEMPIRAFLHHHQCDVQVMYSPL
ncbi:6-phosphogluconolactonase [Legionella impletisoli]|uniref:6-phosphogluconolactonase n=1 Tax=Legionella impletisoli TaxID=343510 RepID=A0A917JKW3_9GAMM|nr:6-phosphogluconolactonase [Legionella impletisoli]GGI75450.1 6-phosphogluconolactonase [Legionella impletisoli]